mgnify:CR=1 FL=1
MTLFAPSNRRCRTYGPLCYAQYVRGLGDVPFNKQFFLPLSDLTCTSQTVEVKAIAAREFEIHSRNPSNTSYHYRKTWFIK